MIAIDPPSRLSLSDADRLPGAGEPLMDSGAAVNLNLCHDGALNCSFVVNLSLGRKRRRRELTIGLGQRKSRSSRFC